MKIYYGIENNKIDVTNVCLQRLKCNDAIEIPSGDGTRAGYFTDPLHGVHKFIFIENDGITDAYDEFTNVKINLVDNAITTANECAIKSDINRRLTEIHSHLKMKHGDLNEEVPEQKMAIKYLTGNEKV